MKKLDFVLAPGYSLYNSVAIKNQNGCEIAFLLENPDDCDLKNRLERAFENHVKNVLGLKNCPKKFKGMINVNFFKGSRSQIKKYVFDLYDSKGRGEIELAESSKKYALEKSKLEKTAAVFLLNRILLEAGNRKTTDIHIENCEVKFRINGKLEKAMVLKKKETFELVQRIKLEAGLALDEKSDFLEGCFSYGRGPRFFVRVSIVSDWKSSEVLGCESVVLRLLDVKRLPLELGNLGFNVRQLEILRKFEDFGSIKNSLVVVAGPEGGGKSTTVASMLVEIVKRANGNVKVISLEDPAEFVIPGVSQINFSEFGKSFEKMLSLVFRQDPDVIVFGEISDRQTALAALRASLSGHLVFATVHAASAAGAFLRLENLGLERKLLTSVLQGCVVQEIEYMDGKPVLLADVCVPSSSFLELSGNENSEEKIENLFIHCVNSTEVLFETAGMLSKRAEKIKSEKSEMERKIEQNLPESFETDVIYVDADGISDCSGDWETRPRKKRRSVMPLFGFEGAGKVEFAGESDAF